MKPKRIIHVTNMGFKPVRDYLHGMGRMLSNGFTLAGHDVINFSDRDISRWVRPLGLRQLGHIKTNKMLLKLCKSTSPDILVFGHADIITVETVQDIKKMLPNIKIMQWGGDLILDKDHSFNKERNMSEQNRKKILHKKDVVDVTFITQANPSVLNNLKDKGCVTYFTPTPVDGAITNELNFQKTNLPFDLIFITNSEIDRRYHCNQWQYMDDLYDNLVSKTPNLTISNHGIKGGKKVFGPNYQNALSNCKMGLNISLFNDVLLYSSNRLSHFIGNGLAVFIDKNSGYNKIFNDNEMLFYSTESELIEKMNKLKKDDKERQRIAENGYKRYYDLFSNVKVAKYMIDVLYGEKEGNSIISEYINS